MSLYWSVSVNGLVLLSLIPNTWSTQNLLIDPLQSIINQNYFNNLGILGSNVTLNINPSVLNNNFLRRDNLNISNVLTNNHQSNNLLRSDNLNIFNLLTNNHQSNNFPITEIQEVPKMDSTEQYIRATCYRDVDQWSVHFANKNALSIKEIEKIISEYGSVKKINQTGDATGICFINFYRLEDAQRCVEGLRGHESIYLRENKYTKNRDSNKRASQNRNNSNDNDGIFNSTNNNREDDYFMSSNSKSEIASEESIFVKITNSMSNDNNQPSTIKDAVGGSKSNNRYDYDEVKQTSSSEKQNNTSTNNHKDVITNIKPNKTFNNLITDLRDNKVIDSSTFNYLSEFDEKSHNEEIRVEIPELVLRKNVSGKVFSEENPRFIESVETQELIIANIHEDYGTNYILHLLEKYQPLAASFVKVSTPYSLRYCHVYFISIEQADKVKKKFDNFKLGNKNLIVLHSNHLTGISAS